MRALLVFLWCCWLGLAVPAQARQATLELEDGRVLRGNVVRLDQGHMTLEVAGRQIELQASQIRRCHFLKSEAPPAPAGGDESGQGPGDGDIDAPEGTVPEPKLLPAASGRPARRDAVGPDSPAMAHGLGLLRLQSVRSHYPWLAPSDPTQWASLGLSLLLVLSLVVHFAAKVAGADRPSLAVSCMGGAFFLVILVLQVMLVPITGANVLAMAVGNGVVGTLVFRLLHRMPVSTACLALCILLAELGVCFGILEGVEMALRMANGEFSAG